jgi:hypothetical protein
LKTCCNSVSLSPVDLRLFIIVKNSSKSTLPLPRKINYVKIARNQIYRQYLFSISQLKYLLHLVNTQVNSLMNEFQNWICFRLHLCPAKKTILRRLEEKNLVSFYSRKSYQQSVLQKIHVPHLVLADFYPLLSKKTKADRILNFFIL